MAHPASCTPTPSTPPVTPQRTGASADEDLVRGDDGLLRCWWPGNDPDSIEYHDREWGVHDRDRWDDTSLFELLVLETFQSGLAWITILRKRANFVRAFAGFDPAVVASWGHRERARLLDDAGIVRNRAKVEATFANARAVLDLQSADTSLVEVVFDAAPMPMPPRPKSRAQVPATTPESKRLATELKQRGFSFIGPTVAYALMQSAGVVDDHLVGCHIADAVRSPGN